MGLPEGSRQCGICDQIVSSSVKGVELVQFGKKRMFHEGCAKIVSEAYLEYMEKYRKSLLDTSHAG